MMKKLLMVAVMLALATPSHHAVGAVTTASTTTTTGTSSINKCQVDIDYHYPKQYVAYKTDKPIVIDGKLDDEAWQEVGFSDRFVDITTSIRPEYDTNMKIRWDDKYLYVGGYVQDPHVWANITYCCHCVNASEDQVIFHGNDFEVFVDTDGTTRWYKEFEINAANADWDLLLDRPYENSGYENSSRLFGKKGFDMVFPPNPVISATATDGILNDPSSKPTYWTVEIAFPLEKLAYKTTASVPPKHDDYWRINFSRVEWKVKIRDNKYFLEPSCQSCPTPGTKTCDNWLWSPMYAIDVHHPEMWGFLQFSDEAVNQTAVKRNEQWPGRYVAHELYYAQVAYSKYHDKTYTDSLKVLQKYAMHPATLNEECTASITITLSANATKYVASIPSRNASVPTITIDQNRLILAVAGNHTVPDL